MKNMEHIRLTPSPSEKIPNQFVCNLPERLGNGGVRLDRFSSGIHLLHMDISLIKPATVLAESPAGYCGINFNLTGQSRVLASKYWPSFLSEAGSSTHYVNTDPFLVKEEIAPERKVKFAIIFDHNTLLDLADEDEESLLPLVKGLGSQIFATNQEEITTQMRCALSQIAACPYSGKIRTLFLEGKMMEVFALKLEQMRAAGKSSPRQPRISKTDIEKIHYAGELLVQNPVNPPNLSELAQTVGMSKTRFYRNFKMVFGYSPMTHLRRHRLRVALQLMRHEGHNVTEAAFAVGYNNLSNFAKIFTAEFGISPHSIR